MSRTRTITPNSRLTIYVENEDPSLADTPVSTVVESTNGVPIVVERAMWWPTPGDAWQEAHNSFGATQAVTSWGFADGEVGRPPVNTQTYFLIANDTPDAATVRVTLLFESGPPAIARTTPCRANSRFNVPVAQEFPEAAGRGFGALHREHGDPRRAHRRRARHVLGRQRHRVGRRHERARHAAAVTKRVVVAVHSRACRR